MEVFTFDWCMLVVVFLLIAFNAILLFTKPLMRFKLIHWFKPLIDAFLGPFKSQYYYWIGIQPLLRNVILVLSVLKSYLSAPICCIIVITLTIIQGYIQPYKNKLINVHELLLLYNFAIMCVLLIFNGKETMNIITVNVMVGLSFLHCLIILVYHVFAFIIANHCTTTVTAARKYIIEKCYARRQREIHNENNTMEIAEAQYNFTNFREPLIFEN